MIRLVLGMHTSWNSSRVAKDMGMLTTNYGRDAFAGGFIAGVVQGKSLEESVDMGQWLASLSIRELGPQYAHTPLISSPLNPHFPLSSSQSPHEKKKDSRSTHLSFKKTIISLKNQHSQSAFYHLPLRIPSARLANKFFSYQVPIP